MAVKDMIYKSDGLVRIHEISEQTDYSERYINKVFIELMGFPPKTFCKIIQFQNTIDFIKRTSGYDNASPEQQQFIEDEILRGIWEGATHEYTVNSTANANTEMRNLPSSGNGAKRKNMDIKHDGHATVLTVPEFEKEENFEFELM